LNKLETISSNKTLLYLIKPNQINDV